MRRTGWTSRSVRPKDGGSSPTTSFGPALPFCRKRRGETSCPPRDSSTSRSSPTCRRRRSPATRSSWRASADRLGHRACPAPQEVDLRRQHRLVVVAYHLQVPLQRVGGGVSRTEPGDSRLDSDRVSDPDRTLEDDLVESPQ